MSVHNADYAISGFSLDGFEISAQRLLRLARRLIIIELRVWGLDNQYDHTGFNEGTDLRDAEGILNIAPENASRIGCVIRLPVDGGHTNFAITLVRREGWTLVEGELYFLSLLSLQSPRSGLNQLIQEMVRVSRDLDLSLLNIVDEDMSPVIEGTEIRQPVLVSIFDKQLLPPLLPISSHVEGKSIMWLVEPGAFLAGASSDAEAVNRFLAACNTANLGKLLAPQSAVATRLG